MSQTPAPPPFPPPPGAYGAPMPGGARQGNGMAITSLIMGILLCIPVITGLGAIIFGAVGIKKTKNPQVGGKGLAIAGLVLGVLNLLIWSLFGSAVWAFIAGTAENRQLAKTFIKDLSEGNVTAAAAACSSNVSKTKLEKASQDLKSLGTLQDTTTVGFNADAGTGKSTHVNVAGAAQFPNAQRKFTVEFTKEGDKWKIVNFDFPP